MTFLLYTVLALTPMYHTLTGSQTGMKFSGTFLDQMVLLRRARGAANGFRPRLHGQTLVQERATGSILTITRSPSLQIIPVATLQRTTRRQIRQTFSCGSEQNSPELCLLDQQWFLLQFFERRAA